MRLHQHVLAEAIYSRRSEAFKYYIRMVVLTSLYASYYSFRLGLGWFRRKLLYLLSRSPFARYLGPLIFLVQLRTLGLKLQLDAVDYNFFWRSLETLRAGFYALYNVDVL